MIAVMNQKGGVGKTTTTLNMAHALALSGRDVTVLDMDPQAHLTTSFGAENSAGADAVLLEGATIGEVEQRVREGIRLVSAGPRLGEAETMKAGGAQRGWLLDKALDAAGPREVVLVDCPPSAGLLAMNALLATREVLIPVAGDYLSLHGLSRLVGILQHIEQTLGRSSRKWVVLTRFHERRRLAREVKEKLLQHFPGQVLATPVRETVALAESPGFGKTIFEYQARSNGAADYRLLAGDLMAGRVM